MNGPRRLAAAAALAAAVGCGDARGGDAARIVPEGLTVSALPGGNGVLDLVALTLRELNGQVELYAALKNVGDRPACDAALGVELFDAQRRSLAAGINGVLAQRFYRRTDGSGAIASCVAPGDVAMATVTDLSSAVERSEVSSVVYRCPYFALDVEPIRGLDVQSIERMKRDDGTAFTGTFVNQFDRTVSRAAVTVFPVDEVGRPLGLVSATSEADLAPGESWQFETAATDQPGVDAAAFPTAALSN